MEVNGQAWTVHVCTWVGTEDPPVADTRVIGQALASLHVELECLNYDFSDRPLTLHHVGPPPAMGGLDDAPPTWYVASYVWRVRILAWAHIHAKALPKQLIHGDMHLANIVATGEGVGFIDFDKVMWAPAVFDLAKLIVSGFFVFGNRAHLRHRGLTRLLDGYTDVRGLSGNEVGALEGLALLLNEETARLGRDHDIKEYRDQALAVGGWWVARARRGKVDPFGVRQRRRPPEVGEAKDYGGHQLALWSEYDI